MSVRLATVPANQMGWWPEAGLSDESEDIKAQIEEIRREIRKAISFSWRDSLRDDIAEVVQSSSKAGWDGYGAEPVSIDSANGALQLIEALPEHISLPSVIPEPGGEIALEWRTDNQRDFSISISGTSLVYAGVFGGSCKEYGEEPFFGALPATILRILTHYFPEA